MKTTLKLLAVVLAIITLTLVAFAADTAKDGSWKQIYTASDLVSAYKNGSLVPANLLRTFPSRTFPQITPDTQ